MAEVSVIIEALPTLDVLDGDISGWRSWAALHRPADENSDFTVSSTFSDGVFQHEIIGLRAFWRDKP